MSEDTMRKSLEPRAEALEPRVKALETVLPGEIEFVKGLINTEDAKVVSLNKLVTAKTIQSSPNTVYAPQLLDRFVLSLADVKSMLDEAAKQKAHGLSYAGKYSLTPQRFDVRSDGTTTPFQYGVPPTDGKQTTSPNDVQWPIITDACWQYYDTLTGIHYRWDQYQANSQKFRGVHWFLDGPVVSVSDDGLRWVTLRTQQYDNSGQSARTGFWIDRENKTGFGANTLFISDARAVYAFSSLVAGSGTAVAGSPSPYGDHRIYWDNNVVKGFLILTLNDVNTHLVIRTGSNFNNIKDAYIYNDPIFNNCRVECPSWLYMKDTVTGAYQQVISIALQGVGAPTAGNNSFVMGTCKYTVSDMTMIQPLRWIEHGYFAYAQIIVDPLQQDGTGGTQNGCDSAVVNVGCYRWDELNGGMSLPYYGFAGGSFIPADLKLVNGIPMCLPNEKFKEAMVGRSYGQAQPALGAGASNTGWIMKVETRSDVWRAELNAALFSFPVGTTIRFHFGTRNVDYVFASGTIDFQNGNSGTTCMGVGITRKMPITASFVTNNNNTLVWEYDNGRIRLYNTNTGEYMSEMIFPDGFQLSAIEVLGNDLHVGGFSFLVNQDGGFNY